MTPAPRHVPLDDLPDDRLDEALSLLRCLRSFLKWELDLSDPNAFLTEKRRVT